MNPLENDFLAYVATVNFLHYAVFLFIICSTVLVGVSLFTEVPEGGKAKKPHLC